MKYLPLSMLLLAIHGVRHASISFLGFDYGPYLALAGAALVAIGTLACILKRKKNALPDEIIVWLKLMLIYIVIMLALGLARGNLLTNIISDLVVCVLFCGGAILGASEVEWNGIRRILPLLVLVSVAITVASLSRPAVTISEKGAAIGEVSAEGRYGIETLAYRTSRVLLIMPLMLALGFSPGAKPREKMIAYLGLVVWFGLAVFFWKRLEVARVIFSVVAIVLALGFYTGVGRSVLKGIAAFVVIGLTSFLFREDFMQLIGRYQVTRLGVENERWVEVAWMLQQYEIYEYLFGRGLGGYYEVPRYWLAGVEKVSEDGAYGRDACHAGMFWPFLKGGVVFCVLYYWWQIRIFEKAQFITNKWMANWQNFAAVTTLPVYGAMLLFGSSPSTSVSCEVLMVGMCVGRIAALNRVRSVMVCVGHPAGHIS